MPNLGRTCEGTLINDRVVLTSVNCILKLGTAELFDAMPSPLFFPEKFIHASEDLLVYQVEYLTKKLDILAENGKKVADLYYHPRFLPSKLFHE